MNSASMISQLSRFGFWASLALLVLTVVWIVTLGLAPTPTPESTATEQLTFLKENERWHVASFATVVPMGLVHVPLWIALAALIWFHRPGTAALVLSFGLIYAPFTVIGYWTQLTTVRGLINLYSSDPETAIAAFEVLQFSDNFWSLSYGIVVLGYGTWGLAALSVFAGTVDIPYRLARVTGILFGIAGVLGVIGAIGFVARNSYLELGVLSSGLIFVPALICTSMLLNRVSKGLQLHQDANHFIS
jgi:hypothetical protein